MALSRKYLTTMGIDPEKIDQIIEAHMDTVNGLKDQISDLTTKADTADDLKKQLAEANKKIEAQGSDEYQTKYEELQKEFNDYKTSQEAQALASAKNKAYREMLKGAGVSEKRLDAILKVTDLSKLELDGDKLKDADKLTETAKTEWADFITAEHKEGADTKTPPEGNGGNTPTKLPTIF